MNNDDFDQLIGTCTAIQDIRQQIHDAAQSDAKVLITGESGVGKEVVARSIHRQSPRRHGRLLIINCAGLPDSLLESELFGHVRGAFTGAYRDKTGLLELGHRGTVFMDEVGEMSLRMQSVLLRFLETGEIQQVGGDRARACVDVRVVAATNQDLQAQVAARAFRADLYFRLNVLRLVVPPVRERRQDIPALVEHFFRLESAERQVPVPQVSAAAMARLVNYDWPGNVREIRNFVQRMALVTRVSPITTADLPLEMSPSPDAPRTAQPGGSFADALFDSITRGGETFWSAVYEPFMEHDLTRSDVRGLIRLGLQHTGGSYRLLVPLLGMPPSDYKRFLNFLRAHECQVQALRLRVADPLPRCSDEMPKAVGAF